MALRLAGTVVAMTTWVAERSNHAGVCESFDPIIDVPSGQAGSYNDWRGTTTSCTKIGLILACMSAHFLQKRWFDPSGDISYTFTVLAVITSKDVMTSFVTAVSQM